MGAITIAGSDIATAVESNQATIRRYITQVKLGKIGPRRERKLHYDLGTIGSWLEKDFLNVTKQEVAECVAALKRDEILQEEGEPYEISTKVTFLKILKPFFCWLHPEFGPVTQPSGQVTYENLFIGWLHPGNYTVTVGPDEILFDDERSILFELCKDPRDKAMFATLYESAARPFEFIALMRSDVEFDHDSASIHIQKGKGGKPRDITLLQDANPLLRDWLFNHHPLRNKSDDFPLWVGMGHNTDHEPLSYVGLKKWVDRTFPFERIRKRVVPYTFRHSRLTDLARAGANQALLAQIAGWSAASEMPAVYIHLSKRDQKPALKKVLGLTTLEPPKVLQGPKMCENCKEINTTDAKVCQRCKMALDSKTAVQMIKERETSLKHLEAQNEDMKEEVRKIKEDYTSEKTRVDELTQLVDALTRKMEGAVGTASSAKLSELSHKLEGKELKLRDLNDPE